MGIPFAAIDPGSTQECIKSLSQLCDLQLTAANGKKGSSALAVSFVDPHGSTEAARRLKYLATWNVSRGASHPNDLHITVGAIRPPSGCTRSGGR